MVVADGVHRSSAVSSWGRLLPAYHRLPPAVWKTLQTVQAKVLSVDRP